MCAMVEKKSYNSCGNRLVPLFLGNLPCQVYQGDEVYRQSLGTEEGFQQGDAEGVSILGFYFKILLSVGVQNLT